jgi:hypothetical protein
MSRLAEIYKREIKTGGNLGSAMTKTLGEKIDPRQVLDRSGIAAALFPSLKKYSATAERRTPTAASSMPSLSIDTSELSIISEATKITAKNSIVLPSMARDMYIMKQNIIKLIKTTGEKPQTTAGDWLSRQMARETSFEASMRGAKKGFIGTDVSSIVSRNKRDGQSAGTALYVESPGFQLEDLAKGAILPGLFKTMLGSLGPLLLAGVGVAGLATLFTKLVKTKGTFLDEEESKAIDEVAKKGGLPGIQAEMDRRAKLPEYERTLLELKDYQNMGNEGKVLNEKQLEGFVKRGKESARAVEEYKKQNKIGPKPTPAPSSSPTPAPSSSPTPPSPTMSAGGQPSTTPTQDVPIGSAIVSASAETGIPAETLAIFGQLESSLGKFVENKLSSAKGAFQFIDSTWLSMLQKHGKKYGYDPSTMTRQEKLDLRFNNKASALMAAEYIKENAKILGIDPTSPSNVDELYLAHFLGPGGAKRVLSGEGLSERQKASIMKYNPNIKTASAEEFLQFASSKTAAAARTSAVQQIAASAPTSGMSVASASTAIEEGRRASSGGGNVVVDNSQKTTVASAGTLGQTASVYDKDIVDALVASSFA